MSRLARVILIAAFLGVLAVPGRVAAQQQKTTAYPYTAIDIGTLGGPSSYFNVPGQVITNDGAVLTVADTATTDTDSANTNPFFTPHDTTIQHAAVWRKGVLTDLGALPGNNDSGVLIVNGRGDGAGASESGPIDPLQGYSEISAVLWKDGHIINLGTLGGNESFATSLNSRDQVVGWAANAIPDPWTLPGFGLSWGTQMRAFLWQGGTMHDLGTLGGPDSQADAVNESGQVMGASFTNGTANSTTGVPTEHPFLWQNGHMQDLGTLGGTIAFPTNGGGGPGLNNRGEVVGLSTLQGDQANHPFLWDGHAMRDLGTFGGNFGEAHSLNQAGDVVGYAATPDGNAHAFLWKNGVLTDLDGATSPQCHFADSINAQDQIVGGSCGANPDGWLWEHGKLYDLNTLVAPSASGLQLQEAHYINNRGEIAVQGVLPNGDQRVVLLVPNCRGGSESNGNCDNGNQPVTTTPSSASARSGASTPGGAVTHGSAGVTRGGLTLKEMVAPFRIQLTQRYHLRVR